TNEVRVIGVLGQNDLDGDFALDNRLHGTVDRAIATHADLLVQRVSFDYVTAEIIHIDLLEHNMSASADRGMPVGVACGHTEQAAAGRIGPSRPTARCLGGWYVPGSAGALGARDYGLTMWKAGADHMIALLIG